MTAGAPRPPPPVQRVTSRANRLLQQLRRLARDPAAYRHDGEVWLEGDHLGAALLARGGRARHAVASDDAWGDVRLRALAEAVAAQVTVVPAALFAQLSALPAPASIGFVVERPAPPPLQPAAPTVILDRVQDPGNVGSILRSASAFGFGQVVAIAGTAALWSPKVLRAAMGAHFGLALHDGVDAAVLDALRLQCIAADAHAAIELPDADLPRPCAWIFGHEGQGVAPALAARCAFAVRIPQPGGEESLNVAAAAAVCLYETSRRR